MEDEQIIALYFDRNEAAIKETETKYGKYLNSISFRILADAEDAEECVNDTYNSAWNSIPPSHPSMLSTYLGKIVRHLSIDRWRREKAKKRGGCETPLVLEELEDCISDNGDFTDELIKNEVRQLINTFVCSLPDTERRIFLRRYWYMDPISVISDNFGFSQSKVKSMLMRTRNKLREILEKEGY